MVHLLSLTQSWTRFSAKALPVCCCLGLWLGLSSEAKSAEDIILNYGALEFSLAVDTLEAYAKTGAIEGELKSYAGLLTPQQLKQLKVGLTTSAEFDHLAIAQFLYSFQGEKILERVSRVIRTKAHQPGFYALRSALILAAADPDTGLTPLNVLKKFPTGTLRVDSGQGLEIIKDLSKLVQQNSKAIAAVEYQAAQEAANTAPLSLNSNLLQPGKYTPSRQKLTLRDFSRERSFPAELYLPQGEFAAPLPLVIISHGLGSDLSTFDYMAEHLASHGFAVAVPEHPGSNSRQIQALFTGLENNVTPPEELINRPLDIKFLLDTLAKDYSQQIDTQNVGMIGQSFGAYTTLALSGATIDWETLDQDCPHIDDSWNLSWLIQCLALQLPTSLSETDLKDERIKAAIAINPLVSSVFGQTGLSKITVPVMLVSGSSDPVTPALSEQITPFTWLEQSDKYLLLLKGGTHFSFLNESAGSIPVPQKAIGPDPKIAQDYLRQIGLAFLGRYIAQDASKEVYLNATYSNAISQEKLPLKLVESLEPSFLELKSKSQRPR